MNQKTVTIITGAVEAALGKADPTYAAFDVTEKDVEVLTNAVRQCQAIGARGMVIELGRMKIRFQGEWIGLCEDAYIVIDKGRFFFQKEFKGGSSLSNHSLSIEELVKLFHQAAHGAEVATNPKAFEAFMADEAWKLGKSIAFLKSLLNGAVSNRPGTTSNQLGYLFNGYRLLYSDKDAEFLKAKGIRVAALQESAQKRVLTLLLSQDRVKAEQVLMELETH
jgi:hypothetical protein